MSTPERRDQIHRWKRDVLAHYVDDHQLQGFDLDGDNAFFVANQLLVAGDAEQHVRSRLEELGARRAQGTFRLMRPERQRSAPAGATSSPAGTSGLDVVNLDPGHGVNVAELAVELAQRQPGAVAPNHLVTGLQVRMGWPDGDPEPAPDALPPLPSPLPEAGGGVTVAVIDTGWPTRMPPNLDWFRDGTDHATMPGEVDESGHPLHHLDHLDDDRDGYLDVEAGHGLFVAGLIRRMAPRARLVFLKALNSDGVGTELGVARAIRAATTRKVDLINLSLGFYTVLDATPAGVEAAVADALDAGIPVVAAAGNDAISSPAYPAYFPGVTGVGALGADGSSLAEFSNHGAWVNVFAPGEQVQSAFVRGREDASTTDDHGADRFRSNTALWSGTSFACGYVSGYLAGVLAELPDGTTPAERVERAGEAIDTLPAFTGPSASSTNRVLAPTPAF
jgi:hypothetical protein